MEYQLIISRKVKFDNIAHPKDAMERFIIDYTELSSMHLKKQKCFLYRVLAVERVLEGEELLRIFRTLSYGFQMLLVYCNVLQIEAYLAADWLADIKVVEDNILDHIMTPHRTVSKFMIPSSCPMGSISFYCLQRCICFSR